MKTQSKSEPLYIFWRWDGCLCGQ